jgi:hypothetical protein
MFRKLYLNYFPPAAVGWYRGWSVGRWVLPRFLALVWKIESRLVANRVVMPWMVGWMVAIILGMLVCNYKLVFYIEKYSNSFRLCIVDDWKVCR